MKLYQDADFLVALWSPDDSNHAQAVTISKKFLELYVEVFIGLNVISEVLTIISQKSGIAVANEIWRDIGMHFTVLYPDSSILKKASKVFLKRTSKNLPFSDCLSFALMEEHGIKRVLTFDKHFKQYGFEMVT